jgi:ABC-type transporter Mla maintaining outer membrane lipid asymmetry permease subunit MlaE
MIETVIASEASVKVYETAFRNILGVCHLQVAYMELYLHGFIVAYIGLLQ